MFLKTLEIFGFKSFADRTKIAFSSGVTALLGPNGCGKSNVVDAIKWVLGEQASKSLRAQFMEDIIFNGTQERKALNVAEVSLTLSNETKIIDIDLTEIVVKRRMYRSGESEYYINNNLVKLKDLRELFFDTGIGKSAYSIMEQGRIDQVLSNKPEERRHLFEEAAGITKFKVRGQEALRKLEKTEENMRQVDGIIHEVKRSYDSLKKQADKTDKYRQIRQKLFESELNSELIKLRELEQTRSRRIENLESLNLERTKIKEIIDGINEMLESNMGELSSLESTMVESQKNIYQIELEKNNIENQIRLFSERKNEIEHKIAIEQGRSEAFGKKIQSIKADNEHRAQTITELEKGITEIEAHIERLDKTVEQSRERISQCEKDILVFQERVIGIETEMDNALGKLRTLTDAIVRDIDQGLSREQNAQRQIYEKSLSQSMTKMYQILDRRKPMFEDALKIGDGAGLKSIELSLQVLEESRLGIKEIEDGFIKFKNSLPKFLDDFLDPSGILNQKRELDVLIEKLQREAQNLKVSIEQRGLEKNALQVKIEESRDRKEEFKLSSVRLGAQLQALKEQTEKAIIEIEQVQSEKLEIEKSIAEDKGRVFGLETKISELFKEKEVLISRDLELKKQLLELESGIKSRNSLLSGKEFELKNSMQKLGSIQEKLEAANIQLSEIQGEIKHTQENFREKHSRDLSEFNHLVIEGLNKVTLKEEIQKFREELKELGSINLMAIEEFAEIKERYDFLSTQLDDLKRAKDDLTSVTSEIRAESSTLFKDTFDVIQTNFHQLFRRLFGGGRAEIKLENTANILDAGIEIYSQPPGKKLENISLLSGGEKSLTAVALLFATYMVKPSPFCLLDEIDAALDESNVGRFVSVLGDFAEKSQFIIITHNKKTVTGAKTLLGVTMEESGVSKLVSIRLAEDQNG